MSSRGKGNKLQNKLNEYIRVLKLAKKPGKEEYMQVAKISAIGILLIGSIGFLIYLGMGVTPQTIANMDKGEIEANFVENLNTSVSSQKLKLQINNTHEKNPTGKIHIKIDTILCELNKTNIELEEISPGGTKTVTLQINNIQENSNVIVRIWGENAATYDSEESSLAVRAVPAIGRR